MPTKKAEGKLADLAKIRKSSDVLIPELQAAALKTSGPDPDRRADVLHPSEMAKEDWCHRASYYRIKHNREIRDEKFSFQMECIFDTGNEAHTKWQRRMRQTGKLWGDWQCIICKTWTRASFEPSVMQPERCLVTGITHIWEYKEVSLTHGIISGHEDGAMCAHHPSDPYGLSDGYLVEVKTIGTGTVRHDDPETLSKHYKELADGGKVYDIDSLWKAITKPFPTHVRQANIYLWLAKQMGLPFERVRFLYELKHNSAVKEFSVPLSDRIMKPILTGIETVTYALEQGKPPECNQKDESGNSCKSCAPYEEEFGAHEETRSVSDGDGRRGRARGRAGHDESGGADAGAAPRKRVVRRRGKAESAGDRPESVGEAPDGDARRVTRRRDRAAGPRADAAVHQPEPVDQVPDGAGSGSTGRRVVRRKGRSAG